MVEVWKTDMDSNGDHWVDIPHRGRIFLQDTGEDDDNVGKDARLIATAPAMYATLEQIYEVVNDPELSEYQKKLRVDAEVRQVLNNVDLGWGLGRGK